MAVVWTEIRDSAVGVVTRLRAGTVIRFLVGQTGLSLLRKRPDQLCVPPSLMVGGKRGRTGCQADHSRNLVPRLRMSEVTSSPTYACKVCKEATVSLLHAHILVCY